MQEKWSADMYILIGNEYVVEEESKDRYYIIGDDRRWSIPKECAEIIKEHKGRIRWYRKGKLEDKLITKFKMFENDIDPYNEEKWDDRKDIDILRDIAVKLNLEPSEIRYSRNIDEFLFGVDYPHRGYIYFYVNTNLETGVNTITLRFGAPNHMIKVLNGFTEREFVDAYTDLAEKLKPKYD